MNVHTISAGECLSSLAARYKVPADLIWLDPANADLVARRKDPTVLQPGDQLVIPAKRQKDNPLSTSQPKKFVISGTLVDFHVRLVVNGKPRSDIPYRITIDKRFHDGCTDADGWVKERVTPDATAVEVVLLPEDAPEERYSFDLGHLDPPDTTVGAKQRLSNLGLFQGDLGPELDEEAVEALKSFQKSKDLAMTGELDAATAAELKKVHDG